MTVTAADDPASANAAGARHGLARRVVVPLNVAALCIAGFVAVAVAVGTRWAPLLAQDTAVEPAAHRLVLAHPLLLDAARVVTNLGSPVAMNLVTVVAMVWLLATRRVRPAIYIATARLLELGVETLVKELVDRPRPVWSDPVASGTNSSFPSGHSAGTTVVVLALLLLGTLSTGRPHTTGARAAATAGVVVGVLLLVTVPVSRVLLGVHYPADVTAGVLLGAACALALRPLLLPPTPQLTVPAPTTPPAQTRP